MPDLANLFTAPWGGAARAQNTFVAPWGGAARVQALGNPWTPPAPPPGGTEVTPGDLTAPLALAPATEYRQTHTMSVTDLRTGAPLNVDAVRIGLEDGGALWTLSASARDPGLFNTLTTGEQPAGVEVTVDGLVWCFLIETVQRPRTHGQRITSFGGRSLAAVADKPYQTELLYSADQPTTAAQLASSALLAAGVELEWKLADWLIPAGAVSLTGTPMDVLRTVAAAVGATVAAHPSEPRVTVESRYPQMPNEWAYVQPEVQIHSRAVREDTFDRADAPTYTGVFVAGQQAGALAYVRLEGTSGGEQAPMVTDPLLTDEAALRERGRVVLGAAGKQARVTRSLPVRTGAGEPGVLQRGALVRWVDEADAGGVEIWHGMVRAVSLEAALPVVRQTVTVERHTAWTPDPEVSTPLVFEGPIADQTAIVGQAFSLDLTPYRSGGLDPFMWANRSGVLPAGLSIVGESIVGTPPYVTAAAVEQVLRVTDDVSQMQDSNAFTVAVGTNGPAWSAASLDVADGAFGATVVAYGAGVFAAINSSPSVASSTFKRSADGGKTWQTVVTGLATAQCARIVYGGGAFVVTTGNAAAARGVYRSVDGGLSWAYSSTALPASGFWYATGSNGTRILSARWGSTQLAVSDDGGATWTTRALPASKNWYGMVWTGARWLLTSRTDRVVYASDDNGETWAALATVPGSGTLGALSFAGEVAFVGPFTTPASTMRRSEDAGATWQEVTLPGNAAAFDVYYAQEQHYWFLFRQGGGYPEQLFVSVNGGATWSAAPNLLPFLAASIGRAYGGGAVVAVYFASTGNTAYAHFPGSLFS